MKNPKTRATCFLLLVAAACPVLGAAAKWTPPAAENVAYQLPALGGPLALDGDIGEWSKAACLPVRSFSYVDVCERTHKWNGPSDAGMEFYAAWNDEGLCVAAVVADDDVINTRAGKDFWQQDCVEVYVDGRSGDKFMRPPYSLGAYQLLVKPPTSDKPADIALNPRDGEIKGLKIGGKRTDTGYVVEVLVPWSAFPEFEPRPGAAIGLQCRLNDYDKRDGTQDLPFALSYQGAGNLWDSPQRFIKWALVNQSSFGPETLLGPLVAIDVPGFCASAKPFPISVEVGAILSAHASSVRVTATDADGKKMFERTSDLVQAPAPWTDSRRASFEWRQPGGADGYMTVRAVVCDRDGRPLGNASRSVLSLGSSVAGSISRLRAANIGDMSQKSPFKAAAYLGVGACIEKLKRAVEIAKTDAVIAAAAETQARLDVLERGKVDLTGQGLLDVLNLAANSDAQVVVQFPESHVASVIIYWGSLPLAWARVRAAGSPDDALKQAAPPESGGILPEFWEKASVAGMQGRLRHKAYRAAPTSIEGFRSEEHVLLAAPKNQSAWATVLNVDRISDVKVDAAVVLSGCPEAVRQAVELWADRTKTPVVGISEAVGKDSVLVAGDVSSSDVVAAWTQRGMTANDRAEGFTEMVLAAGDRVVSLTSPSQQAAERLAALIAAGKPITVSDADAIRQDLLRSAAIPQRKPEVGEATLYCGDLHMHTFYSDGVPSPVGLSLQAMYNYMDFAAISDHNTLSGARLARRLLEKHRFDYPLMIGEEITTGWSHFNAYPLATKIFVSQTAEDFVADAHRQCAAIQWNHPGWPGSRWAYDHLDPTAFAGTGIDAWEHIPCSYARWKAGGVLPPLTGTTDTHDGTFAHPERTIVFARSADGKDVADAIRAKRVVAAALHEGSQFYGPDEWIGLVWSALLEGKALKEAKACQLRSALRNADLPGLLESSQPRRE